MQSEPGSASSFREHHDAATVATHYDQLGATAEDRSRSRIIHMRSFNNWVKAVLINKYARPGQSVLDLCCGRGGDLRKWAIANVSYLVGADISVTSVRQAVERYNEMIGRVPFSSKWIVTNCHDTALGDLLEKGVMFDISSCQFSLHYSFESEKKAHGLMSNAASRLVQGGYFIGTTVDALEIVKRVRAQPGRQRIGNSVFSVEFEKPLSESGPIPPFGARYRFALEDAVNDCPEYLVHPQVLVGVARHHGLELVSMRNLHEFALEECKNPQFRTLLDRMKGPTRDRPLSQDEWEAIGLYVAFVFKKVAPSQRNEFTPPRPYRLSQEEVIEV